MSKIRNCPGSGFCIILAIFLSFALIMACDTSANQAPTANAGSDGTVQLSPIASIILNGSGSDPDGTIASYAWTLKSKPAGAADPVFDDSTKANPRVSGFDTIGNYVFQLIVTDNEGKASAPATVTVNVTPADAPAISNITVSGADPANGKYKYTDILTLGGNAEVAGYTYAWSYTTNPASGVRPLNFSSTTAVNPTISNFQKNTDYTIKLTITDQHSATASTDTVISIAANALPTVSAGNDQTKTLASGLTVTLAGTDDDSDGSIESRAWTCLSYTADQGDVETAYTPAEVTALLSNAGTASAAAALRKAGTYVFQYEVTDNDGAKKADTVTVTVEATTGPQDVSVTFPAFGTNPTVIDLNPIFTPAVSAGAVRFEIKDDKGNDAYWADKSDISLSRDASKYGVMWPWPPPLFTQTFYDNADKKVGEYSFYLGNLDTAYFNHIYDEAYGILTSLPPTPLTLQLTKTITELP